MKSRAYAGLLMLVVAISAVRNPVTAQPSERADLARTLLDVMGFDQTYLGSFLAGPTSLAVGRGTAVGWNGYVLLRGPAEVIDAWDRWSRVSIATHACGVRPRRRDAG